jgi:glycerol-3-phosphate dehydrogenase
VSITGGKLTTYREMAGDTVDAVLARLGGRVGGRAAKRSRTKKLALRGAIGFEQVRDQGSEAAGASGLGDDEVVHLADRFGGEARTLIAMVEADRSLGQPLAEGHPYLRVEVVYATRYEMAVTVDDVLTRRIPLRLRDAAAAVAIADQVAELMAPDLGWSAEQTASEAAAFRAEVERERQAASLPSPGPAASAAS